MALDFLDDVETLNRELINEFEALKARHTKLEKAVRALGERLKYTTNDVEELLKDKEDPTPKTVSDLESLQDRLIEERRQNIGRFLLELKTELEPAWDLCSVSHVYRAEFRRSADGKHSITIHGARVKNGEQCLPFYQQPLPIVSLFNLFDFITNLVKQATIDGLVNVSTV